MYRHKRKQTGAFVVEWSIVLNNAIKCATAGNAPQTLHKHVCPAAICVNRVEFNCTPIKQTDRHYLQVNGLLFYRQDRRVNGSAYRVQS